jgi:hypothetical protein
MDLRDFITPKIIDTIKARTRKDGSCWLYVSSVNKTTGYADITIKGRIIGVHRISAFISHGLDLNDSSEFALHKEECKHLNCWNPDHLYIGTHADNMRDVGNKIRSRPCRKCGSLKRYYYRVKKTNRIVSYCLECKRRKAWKL